MKNKELKNKIIHNLVCPYCGAILTAESFSKGKWQCRKRKCGQLLTYEKWKEFCGRRVDKIKNI